MRIFLAGVSTSNLSCIWKEYAKKLKSGIDPHTAHEEAVRHFMRTDIAPRCPKWDDVSILESYYYARKDKKLDVLIPRTKHLIMDSGAYSFIQGAPEVNWDVYVEEYGRYVRKNKIQDYFELDLDYIVGIKRVEKFRDRLIDIVGWPPIIVHHRGRGKEYFISMCKEYPYVALGGITKNTSPENFIDEKYFPQFISIAHKHGAKIHGLGFTATQKLKRYHFDSVDSTSWIRGNMSGTVYKFHPERGIVNIKKEGYRLKNRAVAIYNFAEWVKFQRYAEINL